MTEYESQLNAVADLATAPGWAIVCQYLDGMVAEAYDALAQCKSSNNTITAGFAREFTRKREIVAAVKTFVSDKLQERIRLNEEEAERLERERLIEQLGENQIEHSSDNAYSRNDAHCRLAGADYYPACSHSTRADACPCRGSCARNTRSV